MESVRSEPGENIPLDEITTCLTRSEEGPNANQESSLNPGQETGRLFEKFSQKFNMFITNPLSKLLLAFLMLSELIFSVIQTANLFTKVTQPEFKINPRYVKYSLIGLLLPPLLIGTALFWIKFLRKKVNFNPI